jgi:hypothetical protein
LKRYRFQPEREKKRRAFAAYLALLDAAEWLRFEMSLQLEAFDLSIMQFRVMEILMREGPKHQMEISRRFRSSKQSMGFVIRRLGAGDAACVADGGVGEDCAAGETARKENWRAPGNRGESHGGRGEMDRVGFSETREGGEVVHAGARWARAADFNATVREAAARRSAEILQRDYTGGFCG